MDDLQVIYDKYLSFTDNMVGSHSPMAVAGVMLAQALSIYKTALNPEEYDQMMDRISDMRKEVKTFTPKVMQ